MTTLAVPSRRRLPLLATALVSTVASLAATVPAAQASTDPGGGSGNAATQRWTATKLKCNVIFTPQQPSASKLKIYLTVSCTKGYFLLDHLITVMRGGKEVTHKYAEAGGVQGSGYLAKTLTTSVSFPDPGGSQKFEVGYKLSVVGADAGGGAGGAPEGSGPDDTASHFFNFTS